MCYDYDQKSDEQVFRDYFQGVYLLLFSHVEAEDSQYRQPPDYTYGNRCCEWKQENGNDERHCKNKFGQKGGDC